MRKKYLDNIRWFTVILVLFYHICFLFNGVGVTGGIPDAESLPFFDACSYVIYPWFMVLLFLIAGMSSRYSLDHRTERQFLKERAAKLLVPSTLGLFVIHWITGIFNLKMGGALEYIPSFLWYPISVISGIGPLWFIQMLFLFSCVLVFLRKLDKKDRIWNVCGKINLPVLFLLFVLIWGASQVGNVPVLVMYRFGIYLAAFLLGYYVFSHEYVQEMAAKAALPLLPVAMIGAAIYTWYYYGSVYTEPGCLQSFYTNLYLWIMILVILGCGKRYLDKETGFTRYMTVSSFGIYILHYPVLITIGYILHYDCHLPLILNYVLAFAGEVIITFFLYEIIKRIPVIRWLVLGQTNKKK